MPRCDECENWTPLGPNDFGYDPDLIAGDIRKGVCRLCPPMPMGSYLDDTAFYPLTLASSICGQCICRQSCDEDVNPKDVWLWEDDKFIQWENDSLIELEL